jgi:ABC-type multidrug transport system fused ATPase/permease subunit
VGCTCHQEVSFSCFHCLLSITFPFKITNKYVSIFCRAWACRGANFACKSGEVVLVLGDESSGKTRLLTAISEAIVTPPKRSRSTTLARGKINIGGLDTTKWEKSQLKRKVGILLNDARTLADISQFHSGSTLANILQPMCPDIPHQLRGSTFSSAVSLASKLSGISTTIIPRLPSKLSTIVTSNEDELSKHSQISPMSASEWSKINLTKILAQTIACNDNPLSSPNSVPKCLVGSVLLLDDATTYMDEVDESQFIKGLRSSGAATILTSKRWALGRFADKIIVMKNGSVVESGTHTGLLAKGSSHGIYAKKWEQITSN